MIINANFTTITSSLIRSQIYETGIILARPSSASKYEREELEERLKADVQSSRCALS